MIYGITDWIDISPEQQTKWVDDPSSIPDDVLTRLNLDDLIRLHTLIFEKTITSYGKTDLDQQFKNSVVQAIKSQEPLDDTDLYSEVPENALI